MNGNNILIIGPKFFGYEEFLIKKCNELNFNAKFYDERLKGFLFKAIVRLKFKKVISLLIYLKYLRLIKKYKNTEFDKILIISPETIDKRSMLLLKNNFYNSKFILYMWDSLANKNSIEIIKYFDKKITFDNNDAKNYNDFEFLPLYYIDEVYHNLNISLKKYDIALIASLHSDRFQIFKEFYKIAKDKSLNFYFHIYTKNILLYFYFKYIKKIKGLELKYIKFKSLSFKQINKIYNNSKAVIDINHNLQNGLTNRTFEVLASNTKLITFNSNINSYDFYTPENIKILNRSKIEIDNEFINNPFKEISLKNYEVKNWLLNILN